MRSRLRLLLSLLLLKPLVGLAFIENRSLYPLGEREAIMANTGVALGGSSGAVYFNPAGLVGIRSTRLSLSGNAYLNTKTDYSPAEIVDGKSLDFSTSGFQAIPSSLVVTKDLGVWVVGFSMLIPQQGRTRDLANFETTNYNIQFSRVVDQQFLLMGGTAAASLNEVVDFGASCFLGNFEGSQIQFSTAVPKSGTGTSGYSGSYTKLNVKGFFCQAGVQRDWGESSRLGLTLKFPFIRLSGAAEYYSYAQPVTGASTNTGLQSAPGEYAIPADISAGLMVQLTERWQFLGDISYQFPVRYTPLASSNFTSYVETRGTPRWNSALSYSLAEGNNLDLGLAWNPSSIVINQPGDSKEDYTVYSLGYEAKEKTSTLGLCLFWAQSAGESKISDNPEVRGKVSTQINGLILTTGFFY